MLAIGNMQKAQSAQPYLVTIMYLNTLIKHTVYALIRSMLWIM